MTNIEQNRIAFMLWMQANYPAVYREALRRTVMPLSAPSNGLPLGALGDDASGTSSWLDSFNTLLNNVTSVATTYLTSRNQVAQVTNNVQRIAAGLPPLNASGQVMSVAEMQAAGYSAATISQVEANLARAGTIQIAGASVPTWALFGGLAVGAFLLLRKR